MSNGMEEIFENGDEYGEQEEDEYTNVLLFKKNIP